MTDEPKEQVLEQCARALLGRQPMDRQTPAVAALLTMLRYDPGDGAADVTNRVSLLRTAAGFSRLFQLRSSDAPGLIFFGAEADPGGIAPGGAGHRLVPSSGAGLTFQAAFEGCVGEAVELLSQFEVASDTLFRAPAPADAALPPGTEVDWMYALSLTGGADKAFPADLCLRRGTRHALAPPWPLSIGCAAGRTFDAAVLHGLLELIERDAAALWWRGGIRGHSIPLDGEAARRGLGLLAAVRAGRVRRRTWLLDIASDLGVPCVAAVSADPEGGGFACGLAARLGLDWAVEAAILEMCQMELAHEVVAAKRRESGDEALNAHDRAHLRRASELDLVGCALLHPLPPRTGAVQDAAEGAEALPWLAAHLSSHGLETFVIDLTRPAFGIPVARVLCPGLEKEPSALEGDRVRLAIGHTGGGRAHTNGIPLM